MSVKGDLRRELKLARLSVNDKNKADFMICEELICSDLYLSADTVLLYAALDDEINIDYAVNDALALGKTVALPVCIDNNGLMKFYIITSFDDVSTGHFNVREPDIGKCEELTDFGNSICVIPGLSFTPDGYRIGYGKGYYDRFLSSYKGASIGLCYKELIRDELPTDEYDIGVNYIITQNGFAVCKED